jgi:hypothetical protein
MAMEQMQELTENFCNLVSTDRQEKENDQAIILALRQEISDMKTLIASLQKVPCPAPRTPFQPRQTPTDAGSYCWSHGYLVAPYHTSKSCHSKKPGHNTKATREKNKGGSQVGKPQA